MSNARWATKEEVAKRLDAVDLKVGVKKAGIPMGFDDNFLYVDTKEAHSMIIGSTGSGKDRKSVV